MDEFFYQHNNYVKPLLSIPLGSWFERVRGTSVPSEITVSFVFFVIKSLSNTVYQVLQKPARIPIEACWISNISHDKLQIFFLSRGLANTKAFAQLIRAFEFCT